VPEAIFHLERDQPQSPGARALHQPLRGIPCARPEDEVSEARLFEQNRDRRDSVPLEAMRKLMARWEVPNLTVAYQVAFYCGR